MEGVGRLAHPAWSDKFADRGGSVGWGAGASKWCRCGAGNRWIWQGVGGLWDRRAGTGSLGWRAGGGRWGGRVGAGRWGRVLGFLRSRRASPSEVGVEGASLVLAGCGRDGLVEADEGGHGERG